MNRPRQDAAVAVALEPFGLEPRGWLAPVGTSAPLLTNGKAARAICLVGHGGGGFWPVFAAWHEKHPSIADPLDAWSKVVIEPLAALLGGKAVFPSDRPWQPFQQWAMAAEGLKPSPLGLLIHPRYGLWHGYRGAILFGEAGGDATELHIEYGHNTSGSSQAAEGALSHPCEKCAEKLCLSACPVDAFSAAGFAVSNCRTFVRSRAGRDGCMESGCVARNACPVGREYRYGADQIRFHMAAFA